MRTHALAILLLLGSFACEPGSSEEVGLGLTPIVGGKASDASDDQVVLILTHVPKKDQGANKFYLNCTGTLLAPNVVLTARHCVSDTTSGTFTCAEDGSLASGPGGTIGSDFVPSETHVLVGSTLPATLDPATLPGLGDSYVHDAATVTCNHDVALIVLQTPIANAKIAPIRLSGDVQVADGLTVVGWGATQTDYIPSGRQRREGVSVLEVGPSPIVHVGGELAASEFLASESVCFGDSGGPAFDATSGAVVGVVSRGPNGGIMTNGSGCVGTQHTLMKTSAFADLVSQAFAIAGGAPWIEGQPEPGLGGGGAGGGGGGHAGGSASKAAPDEGGCSTGRGGAGFGGAGFGGAWILFVAALVTVARRKRVARGLALPTD